MTEVNSKIMMKRQGVKGKYRRLQLYNASHKTEVLKIMCKVTEFQLNNEDTTNQPADEERGALQFELSDDDEPTNTTASTTISKESFEPIEGKLTCSSCKITMDDIEELRQHNKHDWHRYNLKMKIMGQVSVSEQEFYDMIDDLSSIEGSDSEDDSIAGNDQSAAVSKLMDKISRTTILEESDGTCKSKLSSENAKLINSPKTYYENENGCIFGIYKSIAEVLFDKNKNRDMLQFSKHYENPLNMTIIMVSGGHFAAAVMQGSQILLHKTFHSYTVRAKQGGSQGSRDSKSGTNHPKSAGASLRRYNEQSFAQHVQDLMEAWKGRVSACPVIFYRAVGSSSNVLFGGKSPLFQRSEQRLRTIPFPTNRPTFLELKRVQSLLTTLHVYDDREQFLSEHLVSKTPTSKSPKKTKKIDRAKSKSPKRVQDDPCPNVINSENSDSSDCNDELQECLEEVNFNHLKEFDDSLTIEERQERIKKRSKKPKTKPVQFPKPDGVIGCLMDAVVQNSVELSNHIATLKLQSSEATHDEFLAYLNQPVDSDESNLLHLAAKMNATVLIWVLLELGCDPATKNKNGRVPYSFANNPESRAEFRRFMGQFPDKYDYKMAQVPTPLTAEMEAEKAEKKKLLNKIKREKEKQKKMEKHQKDKEQADQERFLKLSDREKRAMAAEQRILAQCKRNKEELPVLVRCFDCACDMTGKVPFEYNQNIFCTTKCLSSHRKKFPTPLSV
ncbi:ankyrin repeat and zinc finger domain-containing protein 1 [Folsomia candida]|nr:ankyrin repeat and zinc finger domain-containing protein 1 [Folsomia candida]